MDIEWTRAFDQYCERTDPSYWAEPVNALSNLAFLIVAFWMWRRSDGARPGQALSAVLALIGVGSYLFHTHATLWSVMLDVVPILIFVLVYIYLANRDFLGWPLVLSLLGAAAYIPYSWVVAVLFGALPFFQVSAGYWPLTVLIFGYGWHLKGRGGLGRDLMIGAGVLCLSLIARSLDQMLCGAIPLGTHFLWHILNAAMLGWMIEVWRRHGQAGLGISATAR